jgi:dTDP-4-dehydrorhamnose 3,5-epimerase-like enzyme
LAKLFKLTPLEVITVEKGKGRVIDVMNDPPPENKVFGCLSVFTVEPGGIRANHYHTDKTERTVVISGKARLICVDTRTKKRSETILDGDKPSLVTIPPEVAHAFVNIGRKPFTAVFYGTEKFFPGEKTTRDYKVA